MESPSQTKRNMERSYIIHLDLMYTSREVIGALAPNLIPKCNKYFSFEYTSYFTEMAFRERIQSNKIYGNNLKFLYINLWCKLN